MGGEEMDGFMVCLVFSLCELGDGDVMFCGEL